MKEAPSRQPPALPEAASNNRPQHKPEDWEEAFALAAATSQEPWTCLALWFNNYSFLTRHRARVSSESPEAEADDSSLR